MGVSCRTSETLGTEDSGREAGCCAEPIYLAVNTLAPPGAQAAGRDPSPATGRSPFALAGVPIGHLLSDFVVSREDRPGCHEKGEPAPKGAQRQTASGLGLILSPGEPSNWVRLSRRVFLSDSQANFSSRVII